MTQFIGWHTMNKFLWKIVKILFCLWVIDKIQNGHKRNACVNIIHDMISNVERDSTTSNYGVENATLYLKKIIDVQFWIIHDTVNKCSQHLKIILPVFDCKLQLTMCVQLHLPRRGPKVDRRPSSSTSRQLSVLCQHEEGGVRDQLRPSNATTRVSRGSMRRRKKNEI